MTPLLVAFLLAAGAPLLVATWRTSLLGLALQGALLAAMALERGWPTTAAAAALLADLLLLRTWFAPRLLHRILLAQAAPRRSDVIPANLLSWTLAGALVLAAFQFAGLVEPAGGEPALQVAVAAAALLLGLLVLASQDRPFAQAVGLLRLENAIALFELGGPSAPPLPVQLALTSVLLLTVLTLGRFLRRLAAAPGTVAAPPGDPA